MNRGVVWEVFVTLVEYLLKMLLSHAFQVFVMVLTRARMDVLGSFMLCT